ncbi:interferon lambda receptor 1 [Xenentodon cancila]
MWSVNIISLLLFCYACLSSGYGEVYFASRNFYNILNWDPVKPAFPGQKVLYSVLYFRDDEQQYRIKTECQNITNPSCDLTAETPSLHDINYRAKVYVNGSCIGFTTSFKPLRDTVLGAPVLSTCTSVAALHVNVTLPQGPNGVSVADVITHSKKGVFKTTTVYILYITEPHWAAQEAESTTGVFNISLKYTHTEYCGYVVYKPNSEPGHSGSENASFCATLPEDHQRHSRWPFVTFVAVAGTMAVLAAIVIISILCMYNYVKGGKTNNVQPTLVITPRTCVVFQNPDRNLILSELQFCTQSEKTIYATIQVKPDVPSHESGGYSPQEIPCHVWQSNTDSSLGTGAHCTTPNARDTSAQSSEVYSAVAVHIPADDSSPAAENIGTSHSSLSSNEEKSWDEDGTVRKLRSHGAPSLAGFDASASNLTNQLVLNTDEPSFASLQSLDSSEWQDSGCEDSTTNTPTSPYCNTYYFPSQQVVHDFHQECQTKPSHGTIFESSYKQNWMPEIVHGAASTDTRTSPERDEEDEGSEGMENSTKVLLGNWKSSHMINDEQGVGSSMADLS